MSEELGGVEESLDRIMLDDDEDGEMAG